MVSPAAERCARGRDDDGEQRVPRIHRWMRLEPGPRPGPRPGPQVGPLAGLRLRRRDRSSQGRSQRGSGVRATGVLVRQQHTANDAVVCEGGEQGRSCALRRDRARQERGGACGAHRSVFFAAAAALHGLQHRGRVEDGFSELVRSELVRRRHGSSLRARRSAWRGVDGPVENVGRALVVEGSCSAARCAGHGWPSCTATAPTLSVCACQPVPVGACSEPSEVSTR